MYMTDNPVGDAEAYYSDRGEAFDRLNRQRRCEHCGEYCGAKLHYRLWGDVVACSKDCALKLLSDDDIEDVLTDWLDTQSEDALEERW